ncbi:MAG: MFS transporter [Planctomycetota bacterium]
MTRVPPEPLNTRAPEKTSTSLRRRALFAALYLSEGAPVGYLWWALPTQLRVAGAPVESITALTATLALPWAFKFLWAPLVDGARGPRWGFSAWILTAQTVMVATLAPLLFLDLAHVSWSLLSALLISHAFAAATQDVAIDALAITTTPPRERGQLNGWMRLGYLLGRGVFGGGILWLEKQVGFQVAFSLLLVCIAAPGWILHRMAPDSRAGSEGTMREHWRRIGRGLAKMVRRSRFWAGLAFAATAGLGFEAVGAVAGPYLIDRGFEQESVGWIMALPVVISMVVGALLGGWLSDRLGRRTSVLIALLALSLAIFVLAGLDHSANGASFGAAARLVAVYLGIGLFTATSYALFMDLTSPELAATEFAAFMGMTNLCESRAALYGGQLIADVGYGDAFAIMAGISLASLLALAFCRVGSQGERDAA